MQVTLQYAAEHLADLASAALRGEDVEIAQPGKPALVLAPRTRQGAKSLSPRRELWGAWEGKVTLPNDAEWREMDQEIEAEMLNRPVFPERKF